MNFTGHLTPQGADLLTRTLQGGTLTITQVLAGSGTTAEGALELEDPRQTVTISDRCADGALATLQVTLAASLADSPYNLTELGVYAQDPEAGEILYQIYRLDQSIEINPDSRLVLRAYLRLALSDSLSLSLALPPSGLLVEEDLMGKADLVNGQVPYDQTPHLTASVNLYVDGTTGNDANAGTREAPFQTIQAAVDALPKNLGIFDAVIWVSSGTYDETVWIYGFESGSLDASLVIQPVADAEVRVNRIAIHSCTNLTQIQNLTLYGTYGPLLDIRNAVVGAVNLTVAPEGNRSGGFADCAVLISIFSSVRVLNVSVDADTTWNGIRVDSGAIMQGNQVTVQNCSVGLQVGNSNNVTCGSVLMYSAPAYSGNATDVVIAGGGSIANNVGGAV